MLRHDGAHAYGPQFRRLLDDEVHLFSFEERLHEDDLSVRRLRRQYTLHTEVHGITRERCDCHLRCLSCRIDNRDHIADLSAHDMGEMMGVTPRNGNLLR